MFLKSCLFFFILFFYQTGLQASEEAVKQLFKQEGPSIHTEKRNDGHYLLLPKPNSDSVRYDYNPYPSLGAIDIQKVLKFLKSAQNEKYTDILSSPKLKSEIDIRLQALGFNSLDEAITELEKDNGSLRLNRVLKTRFKSADDARKASELINFFYNLTHNPFFEQGTRSATLGSKKAIQSIGQRFQENVLKPGQQAIQTLMNSARSWMQRSRNKTATESFYDEDLLKRENSEENPVQEEFAH